MKTTPLSRAVAHHRAGRLKEAEASYREALQADPLDPEANYGFGMLAIEARQPDAGLMLLQRAVSLRPAEAKYWSRLIDTLSSLGRHEAAAHAVAEAQRHGARAGLPGPAPAPVDLAGLIQCLEQGRYAEGEALARDITTRLPSHGIGWKALGVLLHRQGRLGEAAAAMRQSTNLLPGDSEAQCNLGNVLSDQGDLSNATAAYRQALVIDPDNMAALNNLGAVLRRQGSLIEAETVYRAYVDRRRDVPQGHSNLGNVLYDQKRLPEAEACYRRAIGLAAGFAEARVALATVLWDTKRLDEAGMLCRTALALMPAFTEAHVVLAGVNRDLCRPHAAVASYRRALACDPGTLHYLAHAALLLPDIMPSADAIDEWRSRYRQGVAELSAAAGSLTEPGDRLGGPTFYLAYHDRDNRGLIEAVGTMFRRRVPELGFTAPAPGRARTGASHRIRIGFISQFLVTHTIGRLYRGLIQHLDRSRFEVVVIHAPDARRDDFSAAIDAMADRALLLPRGLAAQQQAIAAERLDLLMYPDIGMAPATYFLAFARLAPVQVVGWGHPDTTGLDTVDYFLSSALLEPEGADDLYTERLIRFTRLPCFYPKPSPVIEMSRPNLGLPDAATLYGCPQTQFKLHPDFDQVLADILAGDPQGVIVLLEGIHPAKTAALKARWQGSHPELVRRSLFLPHQPHDRFVALLSQVDVLLDPPHFGSGNSFYEAMLSGTPTVTWPGRFMRGRVVQAAYRQMEVEEAPIAGTLAAYAPLAVSIGRDAGRQATLRRVSVASAHRLFEDYGAVAEFQDFAEAAVAKTSKGRKLPRDWRPGAAGGDG